MSEARSGSNSPQRVDIASQVCTLVSKPVKDTTESHVRHTLSLSWGQQSQKTTEMTKKMWFMEKLYTTHMNICCSTCPACGSYCQFSAVSMLMTLLSFELNRNLSKSNTWIKKKKRNVCTGITEVIGTSSELGLCGEITIFIFNFLILNIFYNMLDLCFLSSLISLKPYPILINWTWFTLQCYYNMLKCNTIHCPYFIARGPGARSLF